MPLKCSIKKYWQASSCNDKLKDRKINKRAKKVGNVWKAKLFSLSLSLSLSPSLRRERWHVWRVWGEGSEPHLPHNSCSVLCVALGISFIRFPRLPHTAKRVTTHLSNPNHTTTQATLVPSTWRSGACFANLPRADLSGTCLITLHCDHTWALPLCCLTSLL